MILAARLGLAGCKSNPVLCLNQAGIYAADIAAPEAAVGTGSLLAGSTILVGKSQEEAVQFGRQVVAASGNLLKDGKANQVSWASLLLQRALWRIMRSGQGGRVSLWNVTLLQILLMGLEVEELALIIM